MNDDNKFAFKITCEPKVTEKDDCYTLTEKIVSTRVKKVDEAVLKQLQQIAEENGITVLVVLDERKALLTMKKAEAFDVLNKCFDIEAYHSRHTETGYELSLTDVDRHYIASPIQEMESNLITEITHESNSN